MVSIRLTKGHNLFHVPTKLAFLFQVHYFVPSASFACSVPEFCWVLKHRYIYIIMCIYCIINLEGQTSAALFICFSVSNSWDVNLLSNRVTSPSILPSLQKQVTYTTASDARYMYVHSNTAYPSSQAWNIQWSYLLPQILISNLLSCIFKFLDMYIHKAIEHNSIRDVHACMVYSLCVTETVRLCGYVTLQCTDMEKTPSLLVLGL